MSEDNQQNVENKLRIQVSLLEGKLLETQQRASKAENTLKLTEANLRVSRTQLSETRTKETDYRVDADMLRNRIRELELQLEAVTADAEKAGKIAERLSEENVKHLTTVEELRTNIAGNQEKLVQVRKENVELTILTESLETKMGEMRDTVNLYFGKLWASLRRSPKTRPSVEKIMDGEVAEPKRTR